MLKNNTIKYCELTQKDKEMYLSIQNEIDLLPSNVKHSKFLIMELLKKNKRGDRFPYYVICGQHIYVSNRTTYLCIE
jgi:hypothetical protein